jgi:hypothetical protein
MLDWHPVFVLLMVIIFVRLGDMQRRKEPIRALSLWRGFLGRLGEWMSRASRLDDYGPPLRPPHESSLLHFALLAIVEARGSIRMYLRLAVACLYYRNVRRRRCAR